MSGSIVPADISPEDRAYLQEKVLPNITDALEALAVVQDENSKLENPKHVNAVCQYA